MVTAELLSDTEIGCEGTVGSETECENETTDQNASAATKVAAVRPKVPRRRQIDPTTCERDYTDDEIEFMQALDEYKRRNGRMFPTCSEILEDIRSLDYIKQPPVLQPQADNDEAVNVASEI